MKNLRLLFFFLFLIQYQIFRDREKIKTFSLNAARLVKILLFQQSFLMNYYSLWHLRRSGWGKEIFTSS